MSEIKRDLDPSDQSYDAQQTAEEIQEGNLPPLNVNVSADYEASKEFSVSELDKTGEGQKAAEAATAPQFSIPEPETTEYKAEPTGDPSDYLAMAKEVGADTQAAGNVDDDLMQKAIEKGQPASQS
jgi:hypothetical protein